MNLRVGTLVSNCEEWDKLQKKSDQNKKSFNILFGIWIVTSQGGLEKDLTCGDT